MKILWLTVAALDSPGFRSTQFGMATALEKLGWNLHLMGKSNGTTPFTGFPGFHGNITLIPRKGMLSTEFKYHLNLWKILCKEKPEFVIFETVNVSISKIGV